jgi:hypothetical protein
MSGPSGVEMQSGSTGSVPAQTSGATVNPADVLSRVLQQNTQELSKYALAAATPIPGGSQGQFPTSLAQPLQQDQPGQLDHREVVGAGNAKAQGIGNSVIATLNTIAKVKTTLDNKKKVEIASSTQQLLQAQAAANQAKQLLQNDPNNAQAKEQVQHNEQIMGTILTGKHGKDIMKGFNIDYTDPESNKTIQHDAVADGKKRAEAATQAFNKGTPQTMAPNTQAQAIYAAKAAEAKSNVDTMRAMGPLISSYMRQQTAEKQIQGRMDTEVFKQMHEDARAYERTQTGFDKMVDTFKHQDQLEQTRFSHTMAEIGQRANLELKNWQSKMYSKNTDPVTLNKDYEEHQRKGTAQISSMTANIAAMEQAKATLVTGKAGQDQIDSITQQIQTAKGALEQYKAAFDGANTYYQKLLMGGSADAGPSSSKSSSGFSSAASYLDPSDSLPDDDEEQP